MNISDEGQILRIRFISIGIEPDARCSYDFLSFTNSEKGEEKYCGSDSSPISTAQLNDVSNLFNTTVR